MVGNGVGDIPGRALSMRDPRDVRGTEGFRVGDGGSGLGVARSRARQDIRGEPPKDISYDRLLGTESDQPRWSERSHIASLLRTPDLFGPGAWSLHIRKRELRSRSLCHAPGPNLLGFKSGHIPLKADTVRVRHLSLISLLISATACSCRFWLRSDTRASSAGGPHWLQPGVGLKSQIGLKRSGPDE